MRLRGPTLSFVFLVAIAAGCGDGPAAPDPSPRLVGGDGALALGVYLPVDASETLIEAGNDVLAAARDVSGADGFGAERSADPGTDGPAIVIRTEQRCEELGDGGYALAADPDGLPRIDLDACTDIGAIYGLYHVAQDLGVRYHHPEETFTPPADESLELPLGYDGTPELPGFALRGFHEHTQHPIPASDFYLRPSDEHRSFASNYIRWLARNRQNAMTWHMLKTVELDGWFPYIADIIEEAHEWGVSVGVVTSYVDQQQNNFRLIVEESDQDDEAQLRAALDRFVDAGFDFVVTQIGSSEFTKPADADVLRWLDQTADHLGESDVRHFAWIHTTCDLEDDEGGFFFHLPLQASEDVGAWVHTTMFYDLAHPAPVYGCQDFSQQVDFLAAADGERAQIYFPESSWWLGFDINLPLVLPITGWTRAHDIAEVLPDHDVEGHITFTSGREWTYWQYDHFLTRATWDRDVSWSDYLAWIAPMYGEHGPAVAVALDAWTALQRRHFLDEDPLIFFYLAGERRQDELGIQAGILARRPKIPFSDVVGWDDEAFSAWEEGDLARLHAIHYDYEFVLQDLPAPVGESDEASAVLYRELHDGLTVYLRRIEHAIALYEGAADVRRWVVERSRGDDAGPDVREAALADAEAHLADARATSDDVSAMLVAAESRYRYPLALVARDKPETMTSYPFGYLAETSSAHFWTRRDDQLEDLIAFVFETVEEAWETTPDRIFVTSGDLAELIEPDSPIASETLAGFMPDVLFGLSGFGGDDEAVTISLDFNQNRLPDATTETRFEGSRGGASWEGDAEVFNLVARSQTGEVWGTLSVLEPHVTLALGAEAGDVESLSDATLAGDVPSRSLVDLVVNSGGIDEVGVINLLKSIFGLPIDEPLPTVLSMVFRFTFEMPE